MTAYFEHYKKSEVTNTQRVIHTPSNIAKKALFYVQEVGYLKSLTPHLGKRSGLNSYLYLVVLSGSGTITYKNSTFYVNAKDCLLLDCQNEYSHISNTNDPWELLWIHYNGLQAEYYYKFVVQKNGHCFQTSFLYNIIDDIYQLINMHNSAADLVDLINSQLITNILTLSITGVISRPNQHSNLKAKLNQTLHYIDQHFTEPISLELLSKLSYISKYHLAREFKKEYNQTILHYILTKRITYAKEMLRFTDLPIGIIAQTCGIGDINYFNKVFKKFELITASEYRKRW